MGAGVSLEALGDLPLDSWTVLYKVAMAKEMRNLAAQVGVVHASDPNQLRSRLIAEANRITGRERPVWADRDRMKNMMNQIFGVKVRDKKDEAK